MELDAEALRAYRQRWQMVAQVNEIELGSATVTERWQQLNSLVRMSAALGLHLPNDESDASAPRRRWNQLQQAYLATKQEGFL